MDGKTECVNQELELYLWQFCNFWSNDWTKWLTFAEFAHNAWLHSVTKEALLRPLMGYAPCVRTPLFLHLAKSILNKEQLELIEKLHLESQACHKIAAEEIHWHADNSEYKLFKVG